MRWATKRSEWGYRGRGASHTVHFSVTSAPLEHMHIEQVQEPSFALGFAMPAAPQLNPAVGAFGAPGRAASQTVHFSVALASLVHIHIEHVHEPSGFGVGFVMPAASQLKPLLEDAGAGALLAELGPAPGDERALKS